MRLTYLPSSVLWYGNGKEFLLVIFLSFYTHVSLSCPPTPLTRWYTKHSRHLREEVPSRGYISRPFLPRYGKPGYGKRMLTLTTWRAASKSAAFYPYGAFICFVWFSEYTAIISLTVSTSLYNGAAVCLLWGRNWCYLHDCHVGTSVTTGSNTQPTFFTAPPPPKDTLTLLDKSLVQAHQGPYTGNPLT
jgi:hypothetical protein